VGIFAEEIVTTDTLGRRTGPRTRHTVEEKLRIVEETRARGASVATVARRHNVNPNQVFAWRQLYRRGLLHPQAAKGDAKMLPVKVSTPTTQELAVCRVRRRRGARRGNLHATRHRETQRPQPRKLPALRPRAHRRSSHQSDRRAAALEPARQDARAAHRSLISLSMRHSADGYP
jgi:transposase-like protein